MHGQYKKMCMTQCNVTQLLYTACMHGPSVNPFTNGNEGDGEDRQLQDEKCVAVS